MLTTNPSTVALIDDLIRAARKLPWGNEEQLDLLQKRVRMVIRRLFGVTHQYYQDLDDITFPPSYKSQADEYLDDWCLGEAKILNLLMVMREEIEVFGLPNAAKLEPATPQVSRRVFVAHGHDEGMREATARTLEKLGLEPIIVGERPGESRTVIEQVEHYSDVEYAVILLSPDDMAYPTGADPSQARPRARQNVIDEGGFFRGRLGRSNILILYKEEVGFEKPSNVDGVLYVAYDARGHWKTRLVQELVNRGYDVRVDALVPSYPSALQLNR